MLHVLFDGELRAGDGQRSGGAGMLHCGGDSIAIIFSDKLTDLLTDVRTYRNTNIFSDGRTYVFPNIRTYADTDGATMSGDPRSHLCEPPAKFAMHGPHVDWPHRSA